MICITIKGNPVAKKRPRFARHRKRVRTYNDQETEESKFLFMFLQEWGEKKPIEGGIMLHLKFLMQRPKSHYGTGKNAGFVKKSAPSSHTSKPDLDNLIKFVKDALNGYAWRDDSQVCYINAMKTYGERPGTEIIVE